MIVAVAAVAGVTMLDAMCAQRLSSERRTRAANRRRLRGETTATGAACRDPPEAMRGAARDFEVPEDMRIPEPCAPTPREVRLHRRAPAHDAWASDLRTGESHTERPTASA